MVAAATAPEGVGKHCRVLHNGRALVLLEVQSWQAASPQTAQAFAPGNGVTGRRCAALLGRTAAVNWRMHAAGYSDHCIGWWDVKADPVGSLWGAAGAPVLAGEPPQHFGNLEAANRCRSNLAMSS
jgi:hypothetical protein